jgi:cytochrome P450
MGNLPRIKDLDNPAFDLLSAEGSIFGDMADPHTPLAKLRRQSPVWKGRYGEAVGDLDYPSFTKPGQAEFLALGYAEVAAAASDPDTFPNGPQLAESSGVVFGNTISIMDPPLHGRFRRIFQAAFLPKTIAKWGQDIVTPVVNRLLDKIVAKGHGDLVGEFTRHYPFHVIYRQLALPDDEAEIFHRLSITQGLFGGGGDLRKRALQAVANLGEYFTAMAAARRAHPGTDLVSLIVQAEVDGERLSDDLVVSFMRQLINAGGETTFHGTSNLLFGLLTHPEQLEAVRRDRTLVPQAVEEALRWESPSSLQMRYVARDVTLGGTFMPAGACLQLVLGAANRDEKVFPDPDLFDIFRPKARHFGFGFGPHLCIGQHLARMEMHGALNAILDRLPNLRLDPAKPAPVITGSNLRHPRHLHVVFG